LNNTSKASSYRHHLVSAGGGELLYGYGAQLSDAQLLAGTAILGGVVSEIGGGKFANGAMTTAFQMMMYNHMSHQGPTIKQLRKIRPQVKFFACGRMYDVAFRISPFLSDEDADFLRECYLINDKTRGVVWVFCHKMLNFAKYCMKS